MPTNSSIETRLTDLLASIGPWIAPLPSAALVARATIQHLGWADWLGLVSGAIIEIMGLTASSTALNLWEHNQTRKPEYPAAPFKLAAVLVMVYLIVTLMLTLFMDIDTNLVRLAPALFPLLALSGTVTIALRSQHKHRLERIAALERERKAEEEKREAERKVELERRRQERQANRQANARLTVAQPSIDTSNDTALDGRATFNQTLLQAGRKAKHDAKLDTLLYTLRDNPALGATDLARQIGTSRQTIYSFMDELELAGKIRRNGHGVEVIDGTAPQG